MMMQQGSILFTLLCVNGHATSALEVQKASPSFMIVSGITGPDQCLAAVDDVTALLEPCTETIAAGDGREVWTFESGGRIRHVLKNKCLQVVGGAVTMGDCNGKDSSWELTPEGQMKLQATGDLCLTQSGSFAGDEDVAHSAPVHATSSSDDSAHGAVKAVDGNEKTYWTSALGLEGTQHFTVDFGDSRRLVSAVIEWELPAMAFNMQASTDGSTWKDVFATDVNGLFTNRIYLGYVTATKLRLVLKKPHPIYAQFRGKTAFGIRRFAVISPRLHTVVDKCEVVAKSADARDKHFLSYVGNFDPCPSKSLRSEVPALESAITALASASSKLAAKFPELGSCGVHSFLGLSNQTALRGSATPATMMVAAGAASTSGQASSLVQRMNGLPDVDGAVDATRSLLDTMAL